MGTNPHKAWNHWDRLLVEAMQVIEDEKCPQCGLPTWVCENEDNRVVTSVKEHRCSNTRKREKVNAKAQEKAQKAKGDNPEWGVQRYVSYDLLEGWSAWEAREAYFEQRARVAEQTE